MPPKGVRVAKAKPKSKQAVRAIRTAEKQMERIVLNPKPQRKRKQPRAARVQARFDPVAFNFVDAAFNTGLVPPARYPDPFPQPTAVCGANATIPLTAVTDSVDGSIYIGVVLYPRWDNQAIVLSASASGALTWGTFYDDPNYTALTTATVRSRVTALTGRLLATGPLLDRGGLVYCGTISSGSSPTTITLPTTVASITAMPNLRRLPVSAERLPADSKVSWVGLDETAYNFRQPADSSAPDDQSATNASLLLWFVKIPDTASTLTLAYNTNTEYIPLPSQLQFSDNRMAVGQPAAVATILQQVPPAGAQTASSDPGKSDMVGWADRISSWLTRNRSNIAATQSAYNWIVGGVSSLASSLYGESEHLRHVLRVIEARRVFHASDTPLATRHRVFVRTVRNSEKIRDDEVRKSLGIVEPAHAELSDTDAPILVVEEAGESKTITRPVRNPAKK